MNDGDRLQGIQRAERQLRALSNRGFLITCYLLCSMLFVVARSDREPYDDSYFFKRTAIHLIETGSLAWNVDEGPTYGNTSLLFQWLAVLAVAITRDYYMTAVRWLSCAALAGTFGVLLSITRRWDRGLSSSLLLLSPAAFFPLLSGMETVFSLLIVSGVLWLLVAPEGGRQHWSLAPLGTLAVYLVRPDAALLVVPLLLLSRWSETRRLPLRELAVLGGGLSAILTLCDLYFGTYLPLPFYAKQAAFSPYDAGVVQMARFSGYQRFAVFAVFAFPAFVFGLGRRDLTNLTLLLSVATHCAYHLLGTIDIMGMHGRFYAPSIPLLVIASARGVSRLLERPVPWLTRGTAIAFGGLVLAFIAAGVLRVRTGFPLERVGVIFYGSMVPATMLATWLAGSRADTLVKGTLGLLLASAIGNVIVLAGQPASMHSDDEFLDLHTARYTTCRGIDTLRKCFGEHIHVYHSEIGIPGLRFLHGEVSDLVGLQSPRWLFREPGSFDAFCMADRPEAIFLPHKNYRTLNLEITQGECLKRYRRVVEQSSSPLYVREDLYPRFHMCAKKWPDPWVLP